jgi:hypothetical protein
MTIAIWKTSTHNAFTTTLDGAIADDTTTVNLETTANLQEPGVLVIDRVDSNNVATPTTREYISFTGISVNSITGVERGLAGSTAQAHSSGAMVEEVWSVTHWGDFLDTFAESHDSTGKLVPQSLATFAQGAHVKDLIVNNSLYASGASLTGFGIDTYIRPVWHVSGSVSQATTSQAGALPVGDAGAWDYFSMSLIKPASGASLVVDINKNMASIFDAGTRPTIVGGGTFVSTASINTKAFSAGDVFTMDIDIGGSIGEDLTVTGKGTI